ncbi:MAG: glycoside hydrolase family 10 protein [Candidatus Weimeria sp.]
MFKKKIAALIITAAVAFTGFAAYGISNAGFGSVTFASAAEASDDDEVRGVWLSIYDFSNKNIGLYTDNEDTFRTNAKKFLKNLSKYHLNTVYMQVRSNDDAAWKSTLFPAMTWISPAAKALGSDNTSQSASETLSFDPLQIMTEEAHAQNIKLIAWMNPYRISSSTYLNPGAASSQTRVVKAVKEVMKYDVDGVIFDDYFYHASSGYKNIVKNKITLTATAATRLSSAKKCAYVDKLIARVYNRIKTADPDATFGIAPQGNLTNDRVSGADVDTWLSKDGYIDYLMPQLYWTDDWGKNGGTEMFSDRIAQFTSSSLDKLNKTRYVALALYRCGNDYSTDHGWIESDTNLSDQYEILKSSGCNGYSLFSAASLYSSKTTQELAYLNEAIEND